MRVVADTSIMVSALLWSGPPHHLLTAAECGEITPYTSPVLLDELAGVLARPKFALRLSTRRVTAEDLVMGYARLAHLVLPQPIAPVVIEDPTDDAVLACALAARAAYIISSDPHLLRVAHYHSSHIVSPRTFITEALRHPPA